MNIIIDELTLSALAIDMAILGRTDESGAKFTENYVSLTS